MNTKKSVSTFFNELRDAGVSYSDSLDIVSVLLDVPYHGVRDHFDKIVPAAHVSDIMNQIQNKVPVAYITGRKEFYGREFKVNSHVLIPRPETEILVSEAVKYSKTKTPAILDLCTGSGCILLTLLKELGGKGIGIDISVDALVVAAENRERLSISTADFINADVLNYDLNNLILTQKIDLITINPPYLSDFEYKLSDLSLFYEPRQALVAEDNGMYFYKNLLYSFHKLGNMYSLKKDITVLFELGYTQSEEFLAIAGSLGLTFDIIQDMAGINRVAAGYI